MARGEWSLEKPFFFEYHKEVGHSKQLGKTCYSKNFLTSEEAKKWLESYNATHDNKIVSGALWQVTPKSAYLLTEVGRINTRGSLRMEKIISVIGGKHD